MSRLDDSIRSVVRAIAESAPNPPPLRAHRTAPTRFAARGPVAALVSFAVVIGLFVWLGVLVDQEQPPATNAPQPSTTQPPATTSSTSPASSTTAIPPPPESFVWPLGNGPGRYAVIEADQVETVGLGDHNMLDIPRLRAGVIVGDELIFGLNQASGVWVWPARPGTEMQAPGGNESVSLLIGQTGTETAGWFHDAAIVDGRPVILYREIESETEPVQERMMLYDLQTGQAVELFDKVTRRDGLSQKELEAPIGDAALGSDRIAALFAFGDSTWIEWYDLEGNPIAGPEALGTLDGTPLEIAIADNKMVLGVETGLNRLITELWIADLVTGELTGPIVHDTEGQSLHALAFDGRWVTATIIQPSGEPVGSYFADITNQTSEVSTSPIAIAPARD